jgi:hypothetical protein
MHGALSREVHTSTPALTKANAFGLYLPRRLPYVCSLPGRAGATVSAISVHLMDTKPKNDGLAVRDARVDLWRDPEWQGLWLSLQARPWRSLGIVPAAKGASTDFTLRIAVTLARTGMVHLGGPVQVADATKVPLTYLAPFLEEIRRCTRDGDLIVVALAPIAENPLSVSIAQSLDAAVLCVLLEHMTWSHVRKTVNQIGVGRFVGSVMFHPDGNVASTR